MWQQLHKWVSWTSAQFSVLSVSFPPRYDFQAGSWNTGDKGHAGAAVQGQGDTWGAWGASTAVLALGLEGTLGLLPCLVQSLGSMEMSHGEPRGDAEMWAGEAGESAVWPERTSLWTAFVGGKGSSCRSNPTGFIRLPARILGGLFHFFKFCTFSRGLLLQKDKY